MIEKNLTSRDEADYNCEAPYSVFAECLRMHRRSGELVVH